MPRNSAGNTLGQGWCGRQRPSGMAATPGALDRASRKHIAEGAKGTDQAVAVFQFRVRGHAFYLTILYWSDKVPKHASSRFAGMPASAGLPETIGECVVYPGERPELGKSLPQSYLPQSLAMIDQGVKREGAVKKNNGLLRGG